VLTQLMQSFRRTQRVSARRVPQWDVGFVLNVLSWASLANNHLSLHELTAKMVFLLALASGERRHALAAMRFPPSFSADAVTIEFDPDFVPKSYFLRRNLSRIKPLVLPSAPAHLVQVCPVATLRAYLLAVDSKRVPSQTSLIIPHADTNQRNVSVHAVGRYLVRLIRFCYEAAEQSPPTCKGHDVRKVATSLRALTSVALDDILDAGQWASPHMFLKHYRVPFSSHQRATLDKWVGLPVARSCLSLQEKD
jgi:hypothetical protein